MDLAASIQAVTEEAMLGIAREAPVVTGAEISRMSPEELAGAARTTDVYARVSPEHKLRAVTSLQGMGHVVAVTGDGVNDAPALKKADVGLAMNTGTMAAKEAGNMVDLDSNPTKLIEVVAIGKQLLITRGALTTFSIANDIAKYFAIIPAMFMAN